jgi:hypothetical protein
VRRGEALATVREEEPGEDLLREVFRDGEIVLGDDWASIRARAAIG